MLFLSNFELVQCNLQIILILTHADKFSLELQKIKKKNPNPDTLSPCTAKINKTGGFLLNSLKRLR